MLLLKIQLVHFQTPLALEATIFIRTKLQIPVVIKAEALLQHIPTRQKQL